MSIQAQNYIVYFIVGVTILQLVYPLFRQLFQVATRRKAAQAPGLYAEICSKCEVRE